jgi:hypothetical protein
MKNITKGDQLMLFVGGKSIAFATAHTLTLTTNTTDIASKDHGIYGAKDVSTITWEITTENLFAESDYATLVDSMLAGQTVDVVFANAASWVKTGIDNSSKTWTPDTTGTQLSGKALITSLTANANTGENATFSATFTGVGAISKASTASTKALSSASK